MAADRNSYHHGDLRAAMERAVLDIVLTDGVGAVTMAGAARRAGVTPGAPYRHFDSLEDLIASTAMACYQRYFERMQGVLASLTDDPEVQMTALIRDLFAFARTDPAAFALIIDMQFGRRSRTLDPLMRQGFEVMVGPLSRIVGAPEDECRGLLVNIAALVLGQASMRLDQLLPAVPGADPSDSAVTGFQLLIAGFRASYGRSAPSVHLETNAISSPLD